MRVQGRRGAHRRGEIDDNSGRTDEKCAKGGEDGGCHQRDIMQGGADGNVDKQGCRASTEERRHAVGGSAAAFGRVSTWDV